MFYNCSKITNLDLSSFDTKNVTNKKSESTEESVEEKQYNNVNFWTDPISPNDEILSSILNDIE